MFAVLRFITAPERGSAIERVALAFVLPMSGGRKAEAGHREIGRTFRHGDVDDLTLTGIFGFEQAGEEAHGKEHRAATHIADYVERRDRAFPGADGMQHPR